MRFIYITIILIISTYALCLEKADLVIVIKSESNEQDKRRAKELGVDPGGLIMIHGQRNGFGWFAFITQEFNWTDGCIALSDSNMDEVWEAVDVGTPIEIKP